DILASDGGAKIRLLEKAARCITPPGDRKEGMDSAVGRPVRIMLKSGFTDRTVTLDERWDVIVRSILLGQLHLWIDKRATSPYSRMGMTTSATVQFEAGPESRFRVLDRTLDRADFLKRLLSDGKDPLVQRA